MLLMFFSGAGAVTLPTGRTFVVGERPFRPTLLKDSNAIVDIAFDWSDYGDTVDSSSWTVDTGITGSADESSTTATKIWLSGGTAHNWYQITNRVVTAGGRTEDQSLYVYVGER